MLFLELKIGNFTRSHLELRTVNVAHGANGKKI
jgi:hypothetical protein